MSFDIVVAADEKLGIGRSGGIPWRLRGDMAHFVALTKSGEAGPQNAVIMGRRTWESIPQRFRPLPQRINVVVSRSELELPQGVILAPSFEAALSGVPDSVDRMFVIGGGMIYEQAIAQPECENIYFTQVKADFDCDTFFPAFQDRFAQSAVLDEAVEDGVQYRIELWTRNVA